MIYEIVVLFFHSDVHVHYVGNCTPSAAHQPAWPNHIQHHTNLVANATESRQPSTKSSPDCLKVRIHSIINPHRDQLQLTLRLADATVTKRPLLRPVIASPYAGACQPKIIYVSAKTPFMSAIKRDRGVKDWGQFIQGHGGMLDRIDSICFSAPIFFHILRYWWS